MAVTPEPPVEMSQIDTRPSHPPRTGEVDVVGFTRRGPLPLWWRRRSRTAGRLVAVAGGEKHGYAIMRDIEELSGGSVTMGAAPCTGRSNG
jgi:hypothetical protein